MKNAILIVSCVLCASIQSHAQNWAKKAIHGEGEIVTQEITLDKLSGVKLGFHGDVFITQGSTQKVVMHGQQNILDNIKREVKNGAWYITNERNVRNAKDVKIYITMSTLDVAKVSGSGSIVSEGKFRALGDVDLGVSGSGDLILDLEAADIDCGVSGSGEIQLKGSANMLDISISGSGDIDGVGMMVSDCEVSISGSGDVSVYVTESLSSRISGSGDIRYKGDAAKVRSSISGSGDVREIH